MHLTECYVAFHSFYQFNPAFENWTCVLLSWYSSLKLFTSRILSVAMIHAERDSYFMAQTKNYLLSLVIFASEQNVRLMNMYLRLLSHGSSLLYSLQSITNWKNSYSPSINKLFTGCKLPCYRINWLIIFYTIRIPTTRVDKIN